VLSGNDLDAFRAEFRILSDRYNLLALEEPWVTATVTVPCKEAMSGYYRALRDNGGERISRAVNLLRDACAFDSGQARWGFDASSYRTLVSAIEARDGIHVIGFVGFSWGSMRHSYLSGKDLEFAVLVRPFPVGLDADKIIDERLRVMREAGLGRADEYPAQVVQERFLPVETFDVASAMVDLGYVADGSFAEYRAQVMQQRKASTIGRLSDNFWLRYGRDSISIAYLAQLQEFCATVGQSRVPLAGVHSPREVLIAQFAPCVGGQTIRPVPGSARTMVLLCRLPTWSHRRVSPVWPMPP